MMITFNSFQCFHSIAYDDASIWFDSIRVLSMLANIIAEEKPEYVGVAFDVGRKTFRTEMFPEYKAQRHISFNYFFYICSIC